MRKLGIVLATLLIASCNTSKWCNDHCPEKIVEKTTIVDSLVYDTVEITIPGNTITLHDTVPCDDLVKELEDAKTRLKIVVKNRKLTAECECKAEKRQIVVQKLIRTITKDKLVINKAAPSKPKKTFWNWLGYTETWISLGFNFFLLMFFILKTFKLKIAFHPVPPFISITK